MEPDGEIDLREILKTFLAESEEQLADMEQALMALEHRPKDAELVGRIFRTVHTLKGSAAALGFPELGQSAHILEGLLDRVRNHTLGIDAGLITLLLDAADVLRKMVPEAVSGSLRASPEREDLFRRLAGAGDVPAGKPRRERGSRAEPVLPPSMPAPPAPPTATPGRSLRVDLEKLDRMLDLAGEMAIARGRIQQLLDRAEKVSEDFVEAERAMDALFLQLQEQIMSVRLVQVGPLFHQQVRTVRDMARSLHKSARIEIDGEDVEVDTAVVEHLRDPLTHMIRNALDHGIEPPQERKAKGKDPCGKISLSASHDAGSIVIRLSDDGAGLSRVRILERARRLGLAAMGGDVSDAAVHRLIFEPGFSTAESVTDLSGRGVGLDVVRRNIESLRGSVGIESREGAGTTLTLRLPLTLAIIRGFSVEAGAESYVIPMNAVIECLELPQEAAGRGTAVILNLRGEPVPCARLTDLLGTEGVARARQSVVVVRHDGARMGLAVDALTGENQTVMKPLGRFFPDTAGIAGAAILGDGRVALILDVPRLFREARAQGSMAA